MDITPTTTTLELSEVPSFIAGIRAIGDFFERPAGEVCIGFALIWTGVLLLKVFQISIGGEVIAGGSTLIARAMVAGVSK